jgi:hypothetical protein
VFWLGLLGRAAEWYGLIWWPWPLPARTQARERSHADDMMRVYQPGAWLLGRILRGLFLLLLLWPARGFIVLSAWCFWRLLEHVRARRAERVAAADRASLPRNVVRLPVREPRLRTPAAPR